MGNKIENGSLNTNLFSDCRTSPQELALQDKSATLVNYSKKTTISKKVAPNSGWLRLAFDVTKLASENMQAIVAIYVMSRISIMNQAGIRESLKTVLAVCEVEGGSACKLAKTNAEIMLCIDIVCVMASGYWVIKYFTKKQ